MKILASILLALMLFLVGQPVCNAASRAVAAGHCCDGEGGQDCNDEDQEEDNQSSGCAGCNPFQSCACCAVSMMLPPVASFPVPGFLLPVVDKPELLTATKALVSTEPSGFWQPPRAV